MAGMPMVADIMGVVAATMVAGTATTVAPPGVAAAIMVITVEEGITGATTVAGITAATTMAVDIMVAGTVDTGDPLMDMATVTATTLTIGATDLITGTRVIAGRRGGTDARFVAVAERAGRARVA